MRARGGWTPLSTPAGRQHKGLFHCLELPRELALEVSHTLVAVAKLEELGECELQVSLLILTWSIDETACRR